MKPEKKGDFSYPGDSSYPVVHLTLQKNSLSLAEWGRGRNMTYMAKKGGGRLGTFIPHFHLSEVKVWYLLGLFSSTYYVISHWTSTAYAHRIQTVIRLPDHEWKKIVSIIIQLSVVGGNISFLYSDLSVDSKCVCGCVGVCVLAPTTATYVNLCAYVIMSDIHIYLSFHNRKRIPCWFLFWGKQSDICNKETTIRKTPWCSTSRNITLTSWLLLP